jgi:hypothetical protein
VGAGVGVGVGVGLGVGAALAAWAAGAVITMSAMEAPTMTPSEALRVLFLFIVRLRAGVISKQKGRREGSVRSSGAFRVCGLGSSWWGVG